MVNIDAYLFFDGKCAEAMRFYERVLNGRLEMLMTYAESPEPSQVPPQRAGRIMHARLVVDGRALMASDAVGDEEPYAGARGFALSLNYDTVEEAERVFRELADGGTVQMALQQTFWAVAFGTLVDRYGTPWMINVNSAEAADRAVAKKEFARL